MSPEQGAPNVSRPLAIDLFCGLGGWTEGLLAEGWRVIGFDIERHVYGNHRYPAQLVLQDVCTLDGAQFKEADLIVSSSPCQEFSYRAMPWKRAKALPPPELGMRLFAQAARIQREASEAAGRHIPMIQENVRGAQKWVGRARWHYGSYYLWGDVPALMPITLRGQRKTPLGSWDKTRANYTPDHSWEDGFKVGDVGWRRDNDIPSQGFQAAAANGRKGIPHRPGGHWTNPAENAPRIDEDTGTKGYAAILGQSTISRRHGSKSKGRKAASAAIAKIPFPLAQYIARTYFPKNALVEQL